MAIYKPSNCIPFLDTVDLTKESFLQCELNTSNTKVTFYKIRILDNANNIIFEGNNYTQIPSSQSGLNGSILEVPLVQIGLNLETAKDNIIYYFNNKWYNYLGEEILNFHNGYIYLPYKWQISLAQGDEIPPEDKWYDMEIASGKVLGSIPDRIQGPLSTKIFANYYIQLCSGQYEENSPDPTVFKGERVQIESYDFSLGNIYPYKGRITAENLLESSYFQIYKYGNSVQDIIDAGNSRYVDYATNQPMSGLNSANVLINGVNYKAEKFSFDNKSEAYWDQHFKVQKSPEDKYSFTPYANYYDSQADTNPINSANRILIKNEGDTSPGNGLFSVVESFNNGDWIDEEGEVSQGYIDFVVRWKRPVDVDTWAELIGKVLYVIEGSSKGYNYQSTATTLGVLNDSPISFVLEKPVEIYPEGSTWQEKVFGKIYKNSNTETFIAPSASIRQDMLFQYLNNDNGALSYKNLIIDSIDTVKWSITHESLASPLEVGTSYSIKSFFNSSDENPFYAYSSPELSFEYLNSNDEWVPFEDNIEIQNRLLTIRGIYAQKENQTWQNYKWNLINLSLGSEKVGKTIYNGEIETTFTGLQDGNFYEINLTVEDEMGLISNAIGYFSVNLENIQDGDFPLVINFDCDTQSIDINFVKEGLIIPEPEYFGNGTIDFWVQKSLPLVSGNQEPFFVPKTTEDEVGQQFAYGAGIDSGVSYSSGVGVIINSEEVVSNNRDYGVKYNKLESNSGVTGELLGPDSNTYTMNSQHTIDCPYFVGVLISVSNEVENLTSKKLRIVFSLEVPDVNYLNNAEELVANENRYKIIGKIYREEEDEQGNWVYAGDLSTPVFVTFKQGDNFLTEWLLNGNQRPIAFGLVDSDLAQKIETNAGGDKYLRDWIITDYVYGNNNLPQENIRHLVNFIFNALNKKMRFPIEPVSATNTNQAIWIDESLITFNLPEGRVINVKDITKQEKWEDSSNLWIDNSSAEQEFDLYKQIDINNFKQGQIYNGRQLLENKNFVFNSIISNFDPNSVTISSPLKIEILGFID